MQISLMLKVKKLILKLGLPLSVLTITVIATVVSLIATFISMNLAGNTSILMPFYAYAVATIVPIIISPIIATSLVKLLFQTLELEKKLRELATTDYLTQLLNRREWMIQTSRHVPLAKRNNSNIAILMLDIDNFKSINDTFGHMIGDKVLIAFTQAIQSTCRTSDIIARFGGEEFIILLPDTSEQQALHLADRLQQQIRSLKINIDVNIITITTSIGISIYDPDKPAKLDTLISQADKALYQAKEQGKNRTIAFHD